jgi:DNA-directed RNA polymerase specialized sigma24 family protein
VLDVSTKTVQRRLNRALALLTAEVGDLRPDPAHKRGV